MAALAPFAVVVSLVALLLDRIVAMTAVVSPDGMNHALVSLLWGTLLIVGGSLIVVLPAGLLIALTLSDYCSRRVSSQLSRVVEVMAAVPTVVWGYWALTVLKPWVEATMPQSLSIDLVTAVLAVAIMSLPTFIVLARRALVAVPLILRENAFALGADRWAAALGVVIPTARSGLVVAVTLALSRAIGESMIVLTVMGAVGAGRTDSGLLTLSALIARVGTSGSADNATTYASAVILVGLAMFIAWWFREEHS